MLLLAVIGMPASGKTLAARIIRRRFRAFTVSTGDVIRDEIRRRGLKYTKETDARIRDWFHRGREHLLIGRICMKLKKSRDPIRVIDGFRSPREPAFVKRCIGQKPIVIAVKASFDTRLKRELKRGRFQKETTRYLLERDRREVSFGLKKLMARADYAIRNDSMTERQVELAVVKLVERLKSEQ